MAVRLRWRNRVHADQVRVYRSDEPFDANTLPTALATLAGDATSYEDLTAEGEEIYYAVGAVSAAALPFVALSRVRRFNSEGDPVDPPPTVSYIGAVVTLTANDDVEAQLLPWDAVVETGATGFWDGANPNRLVVPAGASLVQITAQARFLPASSFNGSTFAVLSKNGASFPARPAFIKRQPSSGSYTDVTLTLASGPLVVVPGDYFGLFWNCSSSAAAILSESGTWMEMEVLA